MIDYPCLPQAQDKEEQHMYLLPLDQRNCDSVSESKIPVYRPDVVLNSSGKNSRTDSQCLPRARKEGAYLIYLPFPSNL